ncbi:hypothetical protein [uncultured Alistipes sp.]|jgi:hypothetical protein|nr:hypothetical protein [uncultured Alistipes sp.]
MRPVYFVFLLFLCAGCIEDRTVVETLKYAETNMQEHPKEVLAKLDSLDRNTIRRRSVKAKYALLYTQVRDKNYIDETDDSLIQTAVAYYQNRGSIRDRFLSYYYLGRVQFNAGNYVQAMVSYTNAEAFIDLLDDDLLAGLLYIQICLIYRHYSDYPSSLEAAQKAYDHFAKTEFTSHRDYALFDIGFSYFYLGEYDRSEEIMNQVIAAAKESGDKTLHRASLGNIALQRLKRNRISDAKNSLREISDSLGLSLTRSGFGALAYIYTQEGKADSADLYIERAFRSSKNKADSLDPIFRVFQISKHREEYSKALDHLEECIQAQDSIVRLSLRQSVIAAQRDFFAGQSEYAAFKLKANARFWSLVILLLLFIIVGIVFFLNRRLRLKNMEISKYVDMAYEIRQTMQFNDSRMSDLVQRLFKDKFEFIDRLGYTYYERQNTSAEQQVIFSEVKKAINDLGQDKKTKAGLEQIVNACNDNVMIKLREQLPQMKEADLELLCYLFAGFSYRTISIFTQEKVENIYNRKSRLRSRIANSDAPDRDLFLKMIP